MNLKILLKKGDIIREIGGLNVYRIMYNTDLEEIANKERKLQLIKCGLCADFEPNLLIEYFRTF